MEVLPRPLGVMMTSGEVGTAQTTSVSMSGVASGFSGLVPGNTYYTTTSGKLVTDGSFYGMSDVQSSNPAVNGYFYVQDAANTVIVGAESVIGVAISSDSILLKSG